MVNHYKISELFDITDAFSKKSQKTTVSFITRNKPKEKPKKTTSGLILSISFSRNRITEVIA
jgi:hypothetical protein